MVTGLPSTAVSWEMQFGEPGWKSSRAHVREQPRSRPGSSQVLTLLDFVADFFYSVDLLFLLKCSLLFEET